MAKPKRFPGLINTSPNGTGMGGSRTVAQAVSRARTSVNPHAGFFDFSPIQYLADADMYGANDVVEERLPSGPNYGPPGFGDPSSGTEYGAIPNRGRMRREIDVMMGARPSGGLGGGAQHPSAASASGPANQYSPSGYGGIRGWGSGSEVGARVPIADNHGSYGGMRGLRAGEQNFTMNPNAMGPETGSGIEQFIMDPNAMGPETGSSVNNFTMDQNPMGPESSDFLKGMSDLPIGPEYSDFQMDPNPMGPEQDFDNMEFRGPPGSLGPTEYDRMAGMDPESGWMKQNSQENIAHNAIQSKKAESEMRERVAAEKLAEEWAERYGLDDDAKKREEEMIAEMQKIQRKQRIMYALAAFSGNQGLANLAGMVAQQDLEILDKRYGNSQNQRMRDMQRSILFDKDGNYDPPESQEEMYRALGAMGATPAEMEAISGQFDYTKDEAKGQNWWSEEQQRYEWTDTGKPPPGGGWVESGDVSKTDTASSGTGTKGAQRDEIANLRNDVARAESVYGVNSPEAEGARDYLDLTEKLYGITEDITDKDPFMSTTMIKAQWDAMLSTGKVYGQKGIDWESVNEKYGVPNGVLIEDAEDFAEFFKDYMKSVNNPVSAEALDEVMSDSDVTTITSDAEYDALDVGAKYRVDGDPPGKTRTKPE